MGDTDKWLRHLFDDSVCIEIKGKCHDCQKEISIVGFMDGDEYTLEGGYPWYFYSINKAFIKCVECYEKEPTLTNFNPTEVYSRAVGYLRPTKQWNIGKRTEFKFRKPYKLEKDEISKD